MRKFHAGAVQQPPRSRRSRAATYLGLGVALLLSPLVFEGGLILFGQWATMFGTSYSARTPTLDALAGWWRSSDVRFGRVGYGGGTWSATTAVPLGIGWALAMTLLFLRRAR